MAIACLVERAPCLPLRMCSISSCTYSPAAVLGLLPSLIAFLARVLVFLDGIVVSFRSYQIESRSRGIRCFPQTMVPISWHATELDATRVRFL
jgi:hypothetical protein